MAKLKLIDQTTPAKVKFTPKSKTAKKEADANPQELETQSQPKRKPDIILNMLSRAKGASIEQLQEATGWQPHSVRAVISILRKKGADISRSQAKDGMTLYHAKKI